MNESDPFKSIRRGLLEYAVLSALKAQRRYVAELLETLAETPFATREGTLYPLLAKLRREELVEHDWEESASGPPRKYHQLTAQGHEQHTKLKGYFDELVETLNSLGESQ